MTTMATLAVGLLLAAFSGAPRAVMQEASPIRPELPPAATEPRAPESKPLAEVELAPGESRALADLGLSLKLISVQEADERCLGGPMGCPLRVRLEVKKGEETETVTVVGRPVPARSPRRGTESFGYRIGLSGRTDRGVRLAVWKKEPPS